MGLTGNRKTTWPKKIYHTHFQPNTAQPLGAIHIYANSVLLPPYFTWLLSSLSWSFSAGERREFLLGLRERRCLSKFSGRYMDAKRRRARGGVGSVCVLYISGNINRKLAKLANVSSLLPPQMIHSGSCDDKSGGISRCIYQLSGSVRRQSFSQKCRISCMLVVEELTLKKIFLPVNRNTHCEHDTQQRMTPSPGLLP